MVFSFFSRQDCQLNLQLDSHLGRGRCSRFALGLVASENLKAVIMWQAILRLIVNLKTNLQQLPSLQSLWNEVSPISLRLVHKINHMTKAVGDLLPVLPLRTERVHFLSFQDGIESILLAQLLSVVHFRILNIACLYVSSSRPVPWTDSFTKQSSWHHSRHQSHLVWDIWRQLAVLTSRIQYSIFVPLCEIWTCIKAIKQWFKLQQEDKLFSQELEISLSVVVMLHIDLLKSAAITRGQHTEMFANIAKELEETLMIDLYVVLSMLDEVSIERASKFVSYAVQEGEFWNICPLLWYNFQWAYCIYLQSKSPRCLFTALEKRQCIRYAAQFAHHTDSDLEYVSSQDAIIFWRDTSDQAKSSEHSEVILYCVLHH